nr:XRE family transcriptional regulator [Moraxella osloensis]
MSDINPERLIEIRAVNGLTQEELANILGKSKGTISKWENGNANPDIQSIAKLADSFKMPIRWFTMSSIESDNSLYQYRCSPSSTTRGIRDYARIRLKWLREISSVFEEWVDFPDLNLPPPPSRLAALNLDDLEIEQYAYKLRKLWELSDRPIEDLTGIVESNGIIVTREPVGHEGMDGVSSWFSNRPYIWLVDDKNNYYRSRFDIAHELGHLVLHRNLLREDCEKNTARYKEVERQAHLFAAHFLMPRRAFTSSYRNITLDNLLIEKKYWGVSVAALIRQYHTLGIISDEYKLRLHKNYSYRRWRKNEPFDDITPPEKPRLMANTIELLLDEGGFEKTEILNKTNYGDKEVESLCALPKGFFKNQIPTKTSSLKLL